MATPCQNYLQTTQTQLDAQILSNPYLLTTNQYQKQNESKLLLLTITKLLHHILHNREISERILIQNKNILNKIQEQQTQINHIQQIKELNNNNNTTILEELSAAFSSVRGDVHEMASTIVNSDEYAANKIKCLFPKMFQCLERNMTNNIIRHTKHMIHTIYNNINNTANTSQQTQPPPNKPTDQPLNIATSRNDNKTPSQTNNTTAAPIHSHSHAIIINTNIKSPPTASDDKQLQQAHPKPSSLPQKPITNDDINIKNVTLHAISRKNNNNNNNNNNKNITLAEFSTALSIPPKPHELQPQSKLSEPHELQPNNTTTSILPTNELQNDSQNDLQLKLKSEHSKTKILQSKSLQIKPLHTPTNITNTNNSQPLQIFTHPIIQNMDAIPRETTAKKEPQLKPEIKQIKLNSLDAESTTFGTSIDTNNYQHNPQITTTQNNITTSPTPRASHINSTDQPTESLTIGKTNPTSNEPRAPLNIDSNNGNITDTSRGINVQIHGAKTDMAPIISIATLRKLNNNKSELNRNTKIKKKKKKLKNNNKQKNKNKKHQRNKKRSIINKKNKNNLNNNKKQLIPFKNDEIENKNQLNNFTNDELEKYIINHKFTDDQFDDWTDYKKNIKKNITAKEYYELLNGKIIDTLIKEWFSIYHSNKSK